MTSLMCVRRMGGNMQVHDTDLVEELIIDSDDHIKTMFLEKGELLRKKSQTRPWSTPNPHFRKTTVDPETVIDHTMRLHNDWLNEKSVKNIQEKADTEARETRKMYSSVLDTEDTFVKDIENFLETKDVSNHRKKELLHKKWNDHVHEPIRREIDHEMQGPQFGELDKRKRELYKEYLEHVNKKGHVFLDTIAPDEYYALSLHPVRPSLLVAETQSLRDPLLSQGRERSAEDRMILRCMTGSSYSDKDIEAIKLPPLPLVPLGRHGTQCHTWLAMPMGDIESPVRLASRRRMRGVYNDSHFDFEEWSKMPFSPAIVDEELQVQKKRTFPNRRVCYNPNQNHMRMSKQSTEVPIET